VTGAEAIGAFGKVGFKLDRIQGSHHVLKRDGSQFHLTVPVHPGKTLGPGLLLHLIESAGLTKQQFFGLLWGAQPANLPASCRWHNGILCFDLSPASAESGCNARGSASVKRLPFTRVAPCEAEPQMLSRTEPLVDRALVRRLGAVPAARPRNCRSRAVVSGYDTVPLQFRERAYTDRTPMLLLRNFAFHH
jgi:predicted RNA binding protein YcfA (HicA-like mRNA interferase family)